MRRLEGGPGQARRRDPILRARRPAEAALRAEAERGAAAGRQDRHRPDGAPDGRSRRNSTETRPVDRRTCGPTAPRRRRGGAASSPTRCSTGCCAVPPGLEARVYEAMRYSALGAGQAAAAASWCWPARGCSRVARRSALQVAAAIEMVHAYSLVHDDLPAMDDSDLRRGRPTCHKQFDEATAMLAGDGLLTMAFEVLAHPDTHGDPAVRCELVAALAGAAGAARHGRRPDDRPAGRDGTTLDIGAITRLQRMKTGALIAFSCEAGAILGKAPARAAHRAARLCPRSRPRLPDRRRPARRRRLGGGDRQAGRRGRRRRQGHLRVDAGRRAGPRPGRALGRPGGRPS